MQRKQESARNSMRIMDLDTLPQAALDAYLEAIEPFDGDLLQRQFQRQYASSPAFQQEEDFQPTEDRELLELFQNTNGHADSFNLPIDT